MSLMGSTVVASDLPTEWGGVLYCPFGSDTGRDRLSWEKLAAAAQYAADRWQSLVIYPDHLVSHRWTRMRPRHSTEGGELAIRGPVGARRLCRPVVVDAGWRRRPCHSVRHQPDVPEKTVGDLDPIAAGSCSVGWLGDARDPSVHDAYGPSRKPGSPPRAQGLS